MSLMRADQWIPEYVSKVALTASTPYVSPAQLMDGAASVTLQFLLTGGAKGKCIAEATNQDHRDKASVWVPCQDFTLDTDGQGYMVFSAVDQLTGMHAMRVRVLPDTDGQITVAVNFRHYSH